MAYEGWLEEQSGEATLSSASDDGSVTVRLAGVVDGASARTICDRLADIALRCHDRIVLDLSQVREISQFGAAMLSHGIRSRPELFAALSLAPASQPVTRTLDRFGVGPPGIRKG